MFDRASLARGGGASQDVGDPDTGPGFGRLADVLSGPLGNFAFQSLRVRPQQTRSIESVERILSAAAEMMFRQKSSEGISVEKISSGAGVAPQAAYRYFKDADELVKTSLRCAAIREHEQIIAILSNRVLPDEAGMAEIVVGIVLDTCERFYRFPTYIKDEMFKEYRQVGYDASLLMSELICKDVDRDDIRHSLDVIKASVALTATIAVATSFFSKRISPLRGSKLERMLENLFISVLQSGGRSSDAFREMESELDAYWRHEIG